MDRICKEDVEDLRLAEKRMLLLFCCIRDRKYAARNDLFMDTKTGQLHSGAILCANLEKHFPQQLIEMDMAAVGKLRPALGAAREHLLACDKQAPVHMQAIASASASAIADLRVAALQSYRNVPVLTFFSATGQPASPREILRVAPCLSKPIPWGKLAAAAVALAAAVGVGGYVHATAGTGHGWTPKDFQMVRIKNKMLTMFQNILPDGYNFSSDSPEAMHQYYRDAQKALHKDHRQFTTRVGQETGRKYDFLPEFNKQWQTYKDLWGSGANAKYV